MAEDQPEFPYYVAEYSKSNRAACKKCKEKIEKGVVRLGKVTANAFSDDSSKGMTSWYHCACLPTKNVPPAAEFRGFTDLSAEDQAKVEEQLSAAATPAKAAPKKEKKRAKEEDEDSEDDKPLKKKKPTTAKPTTAKGTSDDPVVAKYAPLTIADLKAVLKANGQLQSGTKDVLVERCVDGEKYGALPTCPACGKGRLRVEYVKPVGHNGQGNFFCPGYFDDAIGARVACPFKSESVERPAWKQAGEGGGDEGKGKAAGGGKGKAGAALDGEFAGLGAKDAAGKLLSVAADHSLSLPFKADPAEAKRKVGAALLGTRNDDMSWNASAALAQLKEEFPARTEAAAGPAAACAANAALCQLFEDLAHYEAAEGEKFKASAYKKVAAALRMLDYAVTSGPQVSKGKNKVAGIGGASSDKIDEFLDSGKVQRLEDLREKHG